MPIYEFQCENGHRFELLLNVGETADRCERCKGRVHKVISKFGYPRLWNGKGVWVFDRARKSPDWTR